jgi:type 1 glutamine amidotransferase
VRRALIVRGGWDGHAPVACTDSFLPFLKANSFEVEIHEDLEVYTDPARMAGADLLVQCWSMGRLTDEQARGLVDAVRAGAGFAGWHGGIVAAFDALPYLHLTGGRFVYHPPGFVEHELTAVQQRHPIMEGIGTFRLTTEKYWVLTDPLCEVLATVRFEPEHDTPWREPVTMPAVWTRHWGAGRVFVSTVGHRLIDLDVPEIRAITERGLLWAARP